MPSLREVKARISSTQKTSKITKAMHMISASKLRKSEKRYNNYLEYFSKIEDLTFDLINSMDLLNPLLEKREAKNIVYVIITSDKGLAGGYNNNVIKKLATEIKKNENANFKVAVLGKYGLDICRKKNYPLYQEKSIVIRDDVLFIDIEDLSKLLIDDYLAKKVDKIEFIYNNYINTLTQEVKVDTLLPIDFKRDNKNLALSKHKDFIFEEGKKRTVDLVLPMYLKNKFYGYILDAKTSEHAARMNAMKSATDNAYEVISKLEILYNRARQDSITKELTDIVSGANSIN